jgi:hypothetical protein
LELPGAASRLDEYVEEIDARLDRPWERARDIEDGPVLSGHRYRVFRRHETADGPGLLLHLLASGQRVYVANIVPTEVHQLTTDEYNAALVEFSSRFAEPAAAALGLAIDLGVPEVDLAAEVGEDVFQDLLAFSRASNRSTGSSHPSDRERWFRFLVALHRSGIELSTGLLEQWLLLDGWPESVAHDLMLEFEFAMGLLKHVDGR